MNNSFQNGGQQPQQGIPQGSPDQQPPQPDQQQQPQVQQQTSQVQQQSTNPINPVTTAQILNSLPKPEHIDLLPHFAPATKQRFKEGLQMTWNMLNSYPPNSEEYNNALKKLVEAKTRITQGYQTWTAQQQQQQQAQQQAQQQQQVNNGQVGTGAQNPVLAQANTTAQPTPPQPQALPQALPRQQQQQPQQSQAGPNQAQAMQPQASTQQQQQQPLAQATPSIPPQSTPIPAPQSLPQAQTSTASQPLAQTIQQQQQQQQHFQQQQQVRISPKVLQLVREVTLFLPPNEVLSTPSGEHKFKEIQNTYARLLHEHDICLTQINQINNLVQQAQANKQEPSTQLVAEVNRLEMAKKMTLGKLAQFRELQQGWASKGGVPVPPQSQAGAGQNGAHKVNAPIQGSGPLAPAMAATASSAGGDALKGAPLKPKIPVTKPAGKTATVQPSPLGHNGQAGPQQVIFMQQQQQHQQQQQSQQQAQHQQQQQQTQQAQVTSGQQNGIAPQTIGSQPNRVPIAPQSVQGRSVLSPHPGQGPVNIIPAPPSAGLKGAPVAPFGARPGAGPSAGPNSMASQQPFAAHESSRTSQKYQVSKVLPASATASPAPVPMGPPRPTMGGTSGVGGVLASPALAKQPTFVLEGQSERVLSKKKLDEIVRQVTGGEEEGANSLAPEVEEAVLQLADEFVDNVVSSACRLAKLRDSSTLDVIDLQIILERNYNIRIPGYASDEIRTVRRFQPAAGWTQKMQAVHAAKVMGATKTDG